MKKIYYLFCLITVGLATACTHEEEDLFDDSSASRADAAIKANIEVLVSPTNGWHMEYYPSPTQEYGGFNLVLSFNDDGTMKVAGEISNPTNVATSLYTVKQSAGIVLSFDTYNEIFHFFSDPSDPAGVGGTGYGLEGDYDFLFLETSVEKIVLKGKKTGNIAILTPMQSDWSSYITSIHEAEEAMVFGMFELKMGEEVIPVKTYYRTLIFTYEEDGNQKSQIASFVLTESGYKFYAPISIKGVTISGFTFDAANKWFTAIDNPAIKLLPFTPPLNVQFVEGDWYIAYSTLGTYAQTYFTHCKQNYLDVASETLNFAYIGSTLYGEFGFNFNCSNYEGLLNLDYTLIGEDKVSLKFAFAGQGNGVWYHNNMGFKYLLDPFGYSNARTFTLTADDITKPTYITLTEDSNPANKMTLHDTPVYYPFNN